MGALERQLAALQVEDDDEDEAEDGADSGDEDAAEGDAEEGDEDAAGGDADNGGVTDE